MDKQSIKGGENELVINVDWAWFEATALITGILAWIYLAGNVVGAVWDKIKSIKS